MTRDEILTLLHNVNKRPSTIANSLGVSRALITHSMDGRGSREVRLKIARVLSMPPSALWDNVPREQIVVDNDMYFNPELYQDTVK